MRGKAAELKKLREHLAVEFDAILWMAKHKELELPATPESKFVVHAAFGILRRAPGAASRRGSASGYSQNPARKL